jgi:4-amino-4-deoxy-L-arabinose transferase-like glycosyltransferase
MTPGKTALALAACCACCLALFLGKAFHIDDPLFVWAGRHIHDHPTNFYGFRVNWGTNEIPMWEETRNPPLACYYIAGAGSLFGWGEVGLHAAFLVPAAAAVWGTYRLALHLCARPALAALTTLATPAFLVSSTNVMCDTLMLAFWVWAVHLWIDGLARRKLTVLCLAGLFIALGTLTKYFAISLVPLLFLYAVVERRRPGLWLAALAIPLAVMAGYQYLTYSLYGQDLLSEAVGYAGGVQAKAAAHISFGSKAIVGLAFTGGCIAPVLCFTPLLWSRRDIAAALGVVGVFMWALYFIGHLGPFRLVLDDQSVRWGVIAQAAIFAAGGVSLLALAALDMHAHWDARSLLLFTWIVGTFVFTAFVNWTINARSILPAVPAAAILIMRRIDQNQRFPAGAWSWRIGAPLVPAAAIALVVAIADYRQADATRRAAEMVYSRLGGDAAKLWFEGHWGFKYYLQALGGRSLAMDDIHCEPGDVVVMPLNNYGLFLLPNDTYKEIEPIRVEALPWLATMHYLTGAGFYANRIGPLPFAFGIVPPEDCRVFRVTRPVHGKLEFPQWVLPHLF